MFFDDVSTDAAAWVAGNSLTNGIGDQTLTSPPITLPADSNRPITLQFDTHHQLETDGAANCWAGGFVKISTDHGATFTELGSQ